MRRSRFNWVRGDQRHQCNDEISSKKLTFFTAGSITEESSKDGSLMEKVQSALLMKEEPKNTTIVVEKEIFKG